MNFVQEKINISPFLPSGKQGSLGWKIVPEDVAEIHRLPWRKVLLTSSFIPRYFTITLATSSRLPRGKEKEKLSASRCRGAGKVSHGVELHFHFAELSRLISPANLEE